MFRNLAARTGNLVCGPSLACTGGIILQQLRHYRPVDQSGHALGAHPSDKATESSSSGAPSRAEQYNRQPSQQPHFTSSPSTTNTNATGGYQGPAFNRPPPHLNQQYGQQYRPSPANHPNNSMNYYPNRGGFGGATQQQQQQQQRYPNPQGPFSQQGQGAGYHHQGSAPPQQTVSSSSFLRDAPSASSTASASSPVGAAISEPVVSTGGWTGLNYSQNPPTSSFAGAPPTSSQGQSFSHSASFNPNATMSHPQRVTESIRDTEKEDHHGADEDEDMAEELEEGEEGEGEDHHAAAPIPREEVAELKITVHDQNNRPVSVQSLKEFQHLAEDIPPWLAAGIRQTGYKSPMPVQATAIPLLMEGRDAIAIAPTGSGKTVAFAIPALASLNLKESVRNRNRASPSIVVLCPTRELVTQTHKVFLNLCGGGPIVQAVYGGSDREAQAKFIRRGADVIIAAPGRLCDFLETDVISLDKLDFLVLDEADRMLEMGFAPQLSMIMSCLNKSRPRVTMMWSATWSDTVSGLSKSFLNANRLLIKCEGDGHKANKNITQNVYMVGDLSDRMRQMVGLYRTNTITMDHKVIIFAKRKDEIAELSTQVARALGFPADRVAGLHGSLRQLKRAAIIRRFKEGYIRILVATDVAARGLDVPEIDHVINYDLPLHIDSYVHRIGRTGRAGRKGHAHTIVCAKDSSAIVADLSEYYKANQIQTPPELERVFSTAVNRNQFRRSRYKDHTQIQGEFWRTRGVDPNAPKKSFHQRGNHRPSGPRTVNRS